MLLPTFLSCYALLSLLQITLAHVSRSEHHRSVANGLGERAPNIGRYDFFVPGYAVHLISTVGINGKVYFMDKKYLEPGNSTGSYELDPSLVAGPNWENSWRTLHVLDEITCSASLVLPDKAGRIINVAGWTGASTVGLRFMTPSGTFGVQGNTDWEQDLANIVLQRPRWYPTAVTLSNGSILVVGGLDSDNGNLQPNLEILPRIPGGDTTVYLEFLALSYPETVYPFLYVLPSGNVFAAYYNEARVMDKTTFDVVTVLPPIPGVALDDFNAARTQPWSGSAAMMPLKAPYVTPVTIVICGGATFDEVALDTCVSIMPEAPAPQWVIEYMPSTRLLPNFVPLADGTFLILNGAHFGVAGWRNSRDPNFSSVLYDPSLPIGSRMTELASTNIARLYHSEAILMLDGSVLISGSDPQDWSFPQEYRIERFSPPYLLNGLIRPGFTLPVKDWDYKLGYRIVLKGTASTNMRIVLVGASSSTHGNTMGTRTIIPAMKCIGFGCTVYAPTTAQVCPPGWFIIFVLDGPTPSQGQWIRIGGDPAQLGNWPPGPAFTRPGV